MICGLDFQLRNDAAPDVRTHVHERLELDVPEAKVARDDRVLLVHVRHGVFTRIIKKSFSQRRKMMFKLLKTDWPEPALKSAFDQLKISQMARAETLSLEQFVRLTELLTSDS